MTLGRLFVPVRRNLVPSVLSRASEPVMIGHRTTLRRTAALPQLVIVEGSIGVGKSTLACQLARQLDYRVFLEPTTKNPYLPKFYRDPKKYALKLQLWIFRQRFKTYLDAAEHVLNCGKYRKNHKSLVISRKWNKWETACRKKSKWFGFWHQLFWELIKRAPSIYWNFQHTSSLDLPPSACLLSLSRVLKNMWYLMQFITYF